MAVDQGVGLADIHAALLNDDAEQLQTLCGGGGVHLDQQFTAHINPQHVGMTPVALACALNKPLLAKILLENGANPNATFATLNTTSLMTSAFHGNTEVVRLLLEFGADVSVTDTQHSTALGYAFGGTRNIEVVELLLQAGVDVNRKNMLGMNALLLVSGYGNDQLVEMILRAGADPNATNEFGHSALHLSVVGKKDQLGKLKSLGSVEAAAADKSLNRRNLDLAMKEWARLHKDAVVGQQKSEDALDKAGKFMMNIGQKMDDVVLGDDLDDQEAMKRRVDAVWKYRQEKIESTKNSKKSGVIGSLLSCGGGKSKKTMDTNNMPSAKPYVHNEEYTGPKEREIQELNERCTRILRMLIESGCDIHRTENTFGMTALDMAILNGDLESTALLVSYGGDEDHLMKMFASSDLYDALVSKHKKVLKELLAYDRDLDIDMPFSRFSITHRSAGGGLEDVSDEGLTPLTVAVRTNDMDTVKMILKQGADVNSPGYIGRSPIHDAAASGNIKIIQLLLANKADPEQPSEFFKNATPVAIAVIFSQHEAVRFFLKNNCKVDRPMLDGRVSLFKALEAQDKDMVTLLLEANLSTNFIDPQGFMAAMAHRYQSPDRDVEAILNEAKDVVDGFNERERAMEREEQERMRQEEEMLARQRAANMSQPPPQNGGYQQHNGSYQEPPYVTAQPAAAAQPVVAQPAAVAQPVVANVQPNIVVAEPAQPGYVVSVPAHQVSEAAPVEQTPNNISYQGNEDVPPQPTRIAPVPKQQNKDSSSEESGSEAMSDSITESEDEQPPAVPASMPTTQQIASRQDDSEEEEDEDEEESEEETDDDDDFVVPPPAPLSRPPVVSQIDDLDDISDSSEEEESEEEDESDDEDNKKVNNSVETEI